MNGFLFKQNGILKKASELYPEIEIPRGRPTHPAAACQAPRRASWPPGRPALMGFRDVPETLIPLRETVLSEHWNLQSPNPYKTYGFRIIFDGVGGKPSGKLSKPLGLWNSLKRNPRCAETVVFLRENHVFGKRKKAMWIPDKPCRL